MHLLGNNKRPALKRENAFAAGAEFVGFSRLFEAPFLHNLVDQNDRLSLINNYAPTTQTRRSGRVVSQAGHGGADDDWFETGKTYQHVCALTSRALYSRMVINESGHARRALFHYYRKHNLGFAAEILNATTLSFGYHGETGFKCKYDVTETVVAGDLLEFFIYIERSPAKHVKCWYRINEGPLKDATTGTLDGNVSWAAGGVDPGDATVWFGRADYTDYYCAAMDLEAFVLWKDQPFSNDAITAFMADPAQLLEDASAGLPMPMLTALMSAAAGGGEVFEEMVAFALAADVGVGAAVDLAAAIAFAADATTTPSTAITMGANVDFSASAAVLNNPSLNMFADFAAAAAASDGVTGGKLIEAATGFLATADDGTAMALALNGKVNLAVAAADVNTATALFAGRADFSATAGDAVTSNAIIAATLGEAAAANDTATASMDIGAVVEFDSRAADQTSAQMEIEATAAFEAAIADLFDVFHLGAPLPAGDKRQHLVVGRSRTAKVTITARRHTIVARNPIKKV